MSTELPYLNPLVRDLAWTLSSPPLLQRCDAGVRWLDRDWYDAITARYSPYLQQLESDPGALRELVDSQKDRRLGNYFETLWRFWLHTDDRYRVLHANLPLRRGEQTVGEFDFLVQDRETGKTLHWEVAVKFYLGVGDTTQPCNWWGPARRDRLDIKTQRLLEHQGCLSKHGEAQKLLAELGLQVDETWLILKGRLYYPWDRAAAAPQGHHPDHLRGFWLRQGEFARSEDAVWLPLDRDQWLAPVINIDDARCFERQALLRTWSQHPVQRPLCIARISDGRELDRGFIVPDDWPGPRQITPDRPDRHDHR